MYRYERTQVVDVEKYSIYPSKLEICVFRLLLVTGIYSYPDVELVGSSVNVSISEKMWPILKCSFQLLFLLMERLRLDILKRSPQKHINPKFPIISIICYFELEFRRDISNLLTY